MKMGLNARVADRLDMRSAFPFAWGSAALYALFATLAKRKGPGEGVYPHALL